MASASACKTCQPDENPGDGVGFAAWPAYRISNGQMWSMQLRLNDCYRQQRFPNPNSAAMPPLHSASTWV